MMIIVMHTKMQFYKLHNVKCLESRCLDHHNERNPPNINTSVNAVPTITVTTLTINSLHII